MKNYLILATLLLATLHFGHTLDCHKCNGCETEPVEKESCKNVVSEQQKHVCMTQKITMNGTTDIVTIKKCFVKDIDKRDECPSLPNSRTIYCQMCEADLCNAASKLAETSYYLGAILLFFSHRLLCL